MSLQDVCVVNGRGFFELNPSAADVGLQAAIDSLGADGGTVDIYDGSSTYIFNSAVTSDKDNVVIRNHGATWGFSGGSNLYGLRIRGQNWTVDGFRCLDLPGSSLGTAGTRTASDRTRTRGWSTGPGGAMVANPDAARSLVSVIGPP